MSRFKTAILAATAFLIAAGASAVQAAPDTNIARSLVPIVQVAD